MPFLGVVHANTRTILASYVTHLPKHAHVICSGNFSIETTLRLNGYEGEITGCDVSLYTCSLGAYLGGGEIPLALNLSDFPEFEPVLPFLEDQEGRAAAVAVALDALQFHKQGSNYARRQYGAYIRRLADLCEATRGRLRKKKEAVKLSAFHPQDGWDRVGAVPTDGEHVILTFPPTYAGGYEKLYKLLGQLFLWDQPTYRELTSGHEFAQRIIDSGCPWMIGAEKPTPELEAVLGAPIATAPRSSGVSINLYSNIAQLKSKLLRRSIPAKECKFARLTEADEIREDSVLSVHRIEGGEANYIRQVYSSVDVGQSQVPYNYAVAVDGKLIGVIWYALPSMHQVEPDGPGSDEECLYMMADISIPSERYPRLSKLTLLAAVSKELQADLERRLIRRCTWNTTTAFSRHAVSMKYRGIFELHSRKPDENRPGIQRLNYYARMGRWTLAEGLKEWRKKHCKPTPRVNPEQSTGATPEACPAA